MSWPALHCNFSCCSQDAIAGSAKYVSSAVQYECCSGSHCMMSFCCASLHKESAADRCFRHKIVMSNLQLNLSAFVRAGHSLEGFTLAALLDHPGTASNEFVACQQHSCDCITCCKYFVLHVCCPCSAKAAAHPFVINTAAISYQKSSAHSNLPWQTHQVYATS